jgi:glycine dehydrogenase subunit 2
MHEFVASPQLGNGISTLDIAKRLIDYGFHPPTVYFPLIVKEALMIEPTETETKETLEAFAAALLTIAREAESRPELLKTAPHHTPVGRLDETAAARKLVLRYQVESS